MTHEETLNELLKTESELLSQLAENTAKINDTRYLIAKDLANSEGNLIAKGDLDAK
jgi:hypothetical protein